MSRQEPVAQRRGHRRRHPQRACGDDTGFNVGRNHDLWRAFDERLQQADRFPASHEARHAQHRGVALKDLGERFADDRPDAEPEQALWRVAKVAPAAPWYQSVPANASLLAQARAGAAYAVVERGVWDAQGGAPLAVLVDGDPQMVVEVHAMRSFRVAHPAGKIFVAWIAGPRGRAVVAGQRGYRAPG